MFNINNCAARAARSKAKQDEGKLDFSPSEVGEFRRYTTSHEVGHGICHAMEYVNRRFGGFLSKCCKKNIGNLEKQTSTYCRA
jgi:hypothetical protein